MTTARPEWEGDFDAWVRDHWQQLRALARVVTGDPDLAEDVLQDTLIDLYPRWPRISTDGGNPIGYAVRVMGSKNANRRRTAWARRVRVTDAVEALDSIWADGTGTVDDRLEVASALRALSPAQREVVALHYILDLPVQQIADALDRPLGSVTSDLTRARQRLRIALLPGGDPDAR